ncbi:MAG: porin [Planctomycetes bacterium]|nr:porin [Planctomycetota bacterium]
MSAARKCTSVLTGLVFCGLFGLLPTSSWADDKPAAGSAAPPASAASPAAVADAAAKDAPATPAPAPFDWTQHVKIGVGIRTAFRAVEDSAPDTDSYSKDLSLDNARIYVHGTINEHIAATLNTDFSIDTDGNDEQPVRILDAIGELKVCDALNVWMGRLLPPSDRSNLDGPFYLATYEFPIVSAYPAIFAGRDNGVSVWGDLQGGRYKYQVGVFQGRDAAPNDSDSRLYAARFTVNLLDPEPGYYTQSTYYGEKDILAIGLVGQFQNNGAGTADNSGDFSGGNIDILFEKKCDALGGGVVTLEAAFYTYDTDDVVVDAAGLRDADGFLVQASYLIPCQVGWGKFQPHVRYQELDDDQRLDVGVNYVMKGHDARITLDFFWTDTDNPALGHDGSAAGVLLGAQFQF